MKMGEHVRVEVRKCKVYDHIFCFDCKQYQTNTNEWIRFCIGMLVVRQ